MHEFWMERSASLLVYFMTENLLEPCNIVQTPVVRPNNLTISFQIMFQTQTYTEQKFWEGDVKHVRQTRGPKMPVTIKVTAECFYDAPFYVVDFMAYTQLRRTETGL